MSIQENIREVLATLPAGVRVVAVSKFHPVEALQEAYDGGQRIFGESKVQETADKYNLPVLAQIPMDPQLAKNCDQGVIELFEGDYLDGAFAEVEKLLSEKYYVLKTKTTEPAVVIK